MNRTLVNIISYHSHSGGLQLRVKGWWGHALLKSRMQMKSISCESQRTLCLLGIQSYQLLNLSHICMIERFQLNYLQMSMRIGLSTNRLN
ncbi:hypothetical protein FGO68_gene13926 [Halteria grandinella]|uniref:Uncharacterized protein n=1 Tax=Halteria grandinella TaxID=5974 RepID=A0A8J8NA37_HALGN|nr:hypothetical protein FGO68_gene13926 [Halteria grandinella]